MSFGFPAHCNTQLSLPAAKHDDVHARVQHALASLRWRIKQDDPARIVAAAGVSLWSWGETVSIDVLPDHTLAITSKCVLPTQCLDWGKNRRNVEQLVAKLQAQA